MDGRNAVNLLDRHQGPDEPDTGTTSTTFAPRKAADIPDDMFINAVNQAIQTRRAKEGIAVTWATRWDVEAVLAGHPEQVGEVHDYPTMPSNLVLAKARKMILKGKLDGCYCGCRGDLRVP